MKTDIIQNIIQNAGSIENLVIVKQDFESESEYTIKIYEMAHELFMESVVELELDTLDEDDVAPYDDIHQDAIVEIMCILMFGEYTY